MQLLTKREVAARVGYHPEHLFKLEKAGRFPRRLRLSKFKVAWVETEIDAWINERMAERDGVAAE